MFSKADESLAGILLLSSLPQSEIREVEKHCTWHRFNAGEQVFDRSHTGRDVYFVVKGRVNIVNFSLSGREIAYAIVKPGEYFGELSCIDGEARSATAIAENACLLATLPPNRFSQILASHADVMNKVIGQLASIIRRADERIMDLSVLGAVQRVHAELLRLAQPDPLNAKSWVIYPMPTQRHIASRASTTRETVARVIGNLISGGIVRKKDRSLYITDYAKLEQVAARLGPPQHGEHE